MSMGDTRMTVNGDEVVTVVDKQEIDMKDRDPTHMNDHVKVTFEEIFAEPHPTIYSFDNVWGTSFKTYNTTKLWCYRITSLLCAVPAACLWGVYFALASFCTIWCCQPCIKAYSIYLSCIKGFIVAWIDACIKPCYVAMGFLFSNIHVTIKRDSD